MSIFYKSQRVGKNGKPFFMYKFRTLVKNADKSPFATEETYTKFGKFLRKTKFDELPQLWNWIKGDMALFGPRAEEERSIKFYPEEMRKILLSVKPGIVDLASLHFYDEEKILQQFKDPHRAYWEQIRPIKFMFQAFYIENRSILLNIAILWGVFKKIIKSLFK